ncbi:MAG: helix-turn-helix domain-containing protein [Vulcanimicrobiota bacterium]
MEFKKTTGQRTDGAKTVCAMLNGLGGFVVFGVTNSGEIKGQSITSGTLEDIAEEIRRIEPPAFPDIETVMLNDDNGAIVIRAPGGGGPYIYDGRAYSRIGASTVRMPQKHYERLLLERMHASSRWENQPVQSFTTGDLDIAEIHRTIEEAIRRNRLEEPGTREPLELLRGMGLIDTKGRLLNATVVLFSRKDHVLPDFPQCFIKMARFKGIDKTEFIDNRQEYGNAFELFQRARRFNKHSHL